MPTGVLRIRGARGHPRAASGDAERAARVRPVAAGPNWAVTGEAADVRRVAAELGAETIGIGQEVAR